jgi:hypothetical protein
MYAKDKQAYANSILEYAMDNSGLAAQTKEEEEEPRIITAKTRINAVRCLFEERVPIGKGYLGSVITSPSGIRMVNLLVVSLRCTELVEVSKCRTVEPR